MVHLSNVYKHHMYNSCAYKYHPAQVGLQVTVFITVYVNNRNIKVYVGETKSALKKRVEEHRKEVEDLENTMVYTRSSRKDSMSERHR